MNLKMLASAPETDAPISLASARIERLIEALGDVPIVTEPARVKKKSLDFYWYSPVLKPRLANKTAELIAIPRDEADVVRVAAACAKYRVPLTVRGGGTGVNGHPSRGRCDD